MRIVKLLFYCHLVALALALCGLLLVTPHPELWSSDPTRIAIWRFILLSSSSLQILFGSATMLFFGLLCVGARKMLIFFLASLLIVFFLGVLIINKAVPLGIFSPEGPSAFSTGGPGVTFVLLSWFYMGFTSYLLACRLVFRLGLKWQTFWSLALGTYFLIAWDVLLNVALAGIPMPAQFSVWRVYGTSFGLPVYNLLNWAAGGLIFLAMSRLLWGGDLDAQRLVIWLPFGVYTANLAFAMILSFGMGLWFSLFLAAFFVLAPEALAFYPREESHSSHGGPARTSLSQGIWLVMRLGSIFIARSRVKIQVEGLEHVPREGPVLIAARHFHYFYDGYTLVRSLPRRLHTVVALDWLQAQSLRLIIEVGCALADWPVVLRGEEMRQHAEGGRWAYQHVESRRYLRQVMQDAVRLLRAGEVLVIFPEGYPNIDPHHTPKEDLEAFLPFQPGFIKMVELAERDRQTSVAIVPAGLLYVKDGKKHWQTTVRFGSALFLKSFASTDNALQAVEECVHALSYSVSPATLPEPPGETRLS